MLTQLGPNFGENTHLDQTKKGMKPRFDVRSSIILIGLPGTGKSTLAVIASTSLKLRLIETDRCFRTITGSTALEYAERHGKPALLAKEFEVLKHILEKHSSDCVIAVATRTTDVPACRGLLQDVAKSHPLVHVLRGVHELIQHLKSHISREEVTKMYDRAIPEYRSLANYEFYVSDHDGPSLQNRQHLPFLRLKHLEREFLGFIRFVQGKPRHHTLLLPPEDIEFSQILQVPILVEDELLPDPVDIHGVHAIQLQLDFRQADKWGWTSLLNRLTWVHATFRRRGNFPLALDVTHVFDSDSTISVNQGKYFSLLEHAILIGIDYCYLDLHVPRDIAAQFITKSSTTRIVGTWHNAKSSLGLNSQSWWSSPECLSVYWLASCLGCKVVQLSTQAYTMQDNFAMIQFVETIKLQTGNKYPIISAFNIGDVGKLSRMMNRTLTPVVSGLAHQLYDKKPPTQHEASREGIFTIKEMNNALISNSVIKSLKFLSFGSVISHSIGPIIHNAALSALGLPHHYGITQSSNLADVLEIMRRDDFGGLSCANPHKKAIIFLLDGISDDARAITAVNTVYPRWSVATQKMEFHGENTDWIGVTSCIQNNLSPVNTVTPKTTALVIGAGGMAHAAVYALLRLDVTKILIWNRTVSKAEVLALHFNEIYQSMQPDRFPSNGNIASPVSVISSVTEADCPSPFIPPTIIINALSDGEKVPVASSFDLPTSWFANPAGGVYIESAYKSKYSVLMGKVMAMTSRNWTAIGGQELLIEQALPQIELWTRLLAPREVMRKAVGL